MKALIYRDKSVDKVTDRQPSSHLGKVPHGLRWSPSFPSVWKPRKCVTGPWDPRLLKRWKRQIFKFSFH